MLPGTAHPLWFARRHNVKKACQTASLVSVSRLALNNGQPGNSFKLYLGCALAGVEETGDRLGFSLVQVAALI